MGSDRIGFTSVCPEILMKTTWESSQGPQKIPPEVFPGYPETANKSVRKMLGQKIAQLANGKGNIKVKKHILKKTLKKACATTHKKDCVPTTCPRPRYGLVHMQYCFSSSGGWGVDSSKHVLPLVFLWGGLGARWFKTCSSSALVFLHGNHAEHDIAIMITAT